MLNARNSVVFHKGRQLFLIGLVFSLDMGFNTLLHFASPDQNWYFMSSLLAVLALAIIGLLHKTRMVTGLMDLCLYDLLAQLFGGLMFIMRWNPPEPQPLPYHVIVYAIALAKLFYVAFPMKEKEDWPTIGPIGFWYSRKAPDCSLSDSRKFFIYLVLLSVLPASYFLFTMQSSPPPFLRGFIAVTWFVFNWDFLRQHQMLQESYEGALEEKKQLFERLEELEREYPSAVANDDQFNAVEEQELIELYQQSSTESRTLAMKLLQASKFRRQQELAAKAKDQRLTLAQETGNGALRPGTQ